MSSCKSMHMIQLGKLEQVNIREVWKHEAKDFSTWLAQSENLALLADQIGIEIEVVGTEIGVGRFRIDILAKEPSTDHGIIIENQLEPTNHDHLGKVITYAAGLDAKYLIWIVKDVLPEHLTAIEWLNEHLDDDISCFLIRIEVWKIGESQLAPKFEIVGMKNDWAATVKKTANNSELGATSLKQLEFWEHLYAYIKERDSHIKMHTPRPRRYLNFSIGNSIAGVVLVIAPQKSMFTCELYITHDKELLAFLKDREEEIREELGIDFEWFDAKVASGVFSNYQVDDVFSPEKRDEYAEWCYQTVLLYKKVFSPFIEEYRQSN